MCLTMMEKHTKYWSKMKLVEIDENPDKCLLMIDH